MAALLDIVHLRLHALPTSLVRDHGVPRALDRPLLVAAWLIGADGRLACTWSAEPDDPA